MGSKLTSTGVTFGSNTTEQQLPVKTVNSQSPDATGAITIDLGDAGDTSVETFGTRYHGGGSISGDHEGYILIDKSNQIRFMGNQRQYRAGDAFHCYDKYRTVTLPNHDSSDKITFTKLGKDNMYALTQSGKCYMSGSNVHGQCPIEETPADPKDTARNQNNIMGQVNHNKTFLKVVGGISNTYNNLFIDEDNVLWGCGQNAWGYVLGNNWGNTPSHWSQAAANATYIPSNKYNSGKQLVQIMTGVQDVHIGGVYYTSGSIGSVTGNYNHSVYALKTNGQVWTCGYNAFGQLGTGTTTSRDEYLQISSAAGLGTIVKLKISSGLNAVSVYALNSNGDLFCWGYNGYGQLGLGDLVNRNVPVLTKTQVADFWVSSGAHSTSVFVKGSNDALYVTGRNDQGQLGLGDTTDRSTWALVSLSTSIVGNISDICTAEGHSTWILYEDGSGKGKILSCGYNGYGQLGLGDVTARQTFELIKHSPDDVKEIWVTAYTGSIAYSSLHVKDSQSRLWACGYCNYNIFDHDNRDRYILDRVKL